MSSVGNVGSGSNTYPVTNKETAAMLEKSYLRDKPDPGFTNTQSGAIHYTGLGSGQDYDTLIDKMVQKERTHIVRLLKWRKDWDDKTTAFEEVRDLLRSYHTTLSMLDTPNEFFIKDTESSNRDVLTAAATSEAGEGTHKITVEQLAQSEIVVSTGGLANKEDAVATTAGTLEYKYGNKTVTVEVPKNMTLSMLVTRINNDSNNPGIRASLIYDGSAYHLQLRGKDQGQDHSLTVTGGTNIDPGLLGYDKIQSAQDAIIKVDGWTQEIKRPSNVFADVIPGMTMSLKNTGETTITTSINTGGMKENIVKFVDGLNAIIGKIRDLSKVDPLTKAGSLLTGNYGLQIIATQLRAIAIGRGAGLGFDDEFSTLGAIGITTDAREGSPTHGQLLVDDAKLDAALKKDPKKVAMLFSADNTGATSSTDFSFESQINGITTGGVYDVSYSILGDPDDPAFIASLGPDKTFADAFANVMIGGHPAKVSRKDGIYFLTSLSGPSKGLMLRLTNMAVGDYSGTVKIAQGKTSELASKAYLLAGSEGPLNILQDNYKTIHDNINKKIEYEERRIILFEKHLRDRFAKLEALLGTYNNLSKSIESQIKKLGTD